MATKTKAKKAIKAKRNTGPRKAASRPVERNQPEALRVRVLTNSLTVNDIEASIRWYRDVVGFTVEGDMVRDGVRTGARLKAGSMILRIGQDDWAKGRDRKKGLGFRLYLSTDQDVDKLAARIKANGGKLDAEPESFPAYGVRAFSITDPSGFCFTISKPLD
ncbi:MAG TPA: VOC family protein [Gemmatimonadales bacterium]